MNVLYFILPLSLLITVGAVITFILAVRKGQFDDLETPAHRILLDDDQDEGMRSTHESRRN